MTSRAWTLLIVLASLWGASYMFIKLGLEDMSAPMVVFVRAALAALVLLPLAAARGALAPLRGAIPAIFVLAAIQVAAPFLLISFGEVHIDSSLAGILVASAPVLTALLAPLVDRSERSSGVALAGVALGIVGVGLLLGVDAAGSRETLLGALMVLLASLGYVVGAFFLKRRFAGAPPVGVVTATMAASALLTLPWALATAPAELPGLKATGAMLALGVAGTGIAFVLYYRLIADIGAARSSLVAYIAPIFAIFYGVALLGESLSVATVGGLALIVAGSWLAAGGRAEGSAAAEPPRSAPAADAAAPEPAPAPAAVAAGRAA